MMYSFLKRILSLTGKKLTILIWEESTPDETENFSIRPAALVSLIATCQVIGLIIFFLFFYLTPLGSMLFSKEDQKVREQILEINTRVLALRDSLDARELQLTNFKRALAEGSDTTFQTSLTALGTNWIEEFRGSWQNMPEIDFEEEFNFNPSEIILSSDDFFSGSLSFPDRFPLEGTVTRRFDPSTGHFGIDIATAEGTQIRTLAGGVVFFASWTVNYGYVIGIQHSLGYITIYKHCLSLFRKKGDFVNTGDLLGTVGSTGILSSGPHLHFELWKNGKSLNPSHYFVNL